MGFEAVVGVLSTSLQVSFIIVFYLEALNEPSSPPDIHVFVFSSMSSYLKATKTLLLQRFYWCKKSLRGPVAPKALVE